MYPEISPTSWIHKLKAQAGEPSPTTAPRAHRRESRAGSVTTGAKRGENPDTLAANIGDGTDAINFILVAAGCPAHLRPLIDCLVGLAGDRTAWFEADDLMVGMRARASGDEMSRDAARKWVQRWRKELCDWQSLKNLALIECAPGGQDSDGKLYKSRYKVNLLQLAADAVEAARGCPKWDRDPSRALELASEAILEDTPQTNPYKQRFRPPRQDDDALLKRNPKTATTLLLEAARILSERGEDVEMWLETFAESVKQKVRSVHTIKKEQWTKLSTGQESQGGDVPAGQESLSTLPGQPAEVIVEPALEPIAQAMGGLEAFAGVGATSFLVTMKLEATGQAQSERLTLKDAVLKLPEFIERNSAGEESFIMRPEGAPLIQFDDCGASERDLLAPFAFFEEETSLENYQSWLALPSGTGEEERKRVRDRLLKGALLGSSANGGAGGATRWPGSLNCKPERRCVDGSFPRVRLITAIHNRIVTVSELEDAGLLASLPPCDSSFPALERLVDKNVHRGGGHVPDYEDSLNLVSLKKNGKPNRSDADLHFAATCFDWKLTVDETVALLKRLSEKARARKDDYAERTVKEAWFRKSLPNQWRARKRRVRLNANASEEQAAN